MQNSREALQFFWSLYSAFALEKNLKMLNFCIFLPLKEEPLVTTCNETNAPSSKNI